MMRSIALLDPLAPLCWRGMALWPDGIGTALASAQGNEPDLTLRLQEIVAREEASNWGALRPDRCDLAALRVEACQHHGWLQRRGQGGGMPCLTYLLNPLMPCASPLMGDRWVAQLGDLLPALETTAANIDRQHSEPVDPHITAFISARLERRMDLERVQLRAAMLRRSALHNFGCWHSCSHGCTQDRCRRSPPGWPRGRDRAGNLAQPRTPFRSGGAVAEADVGRLSGTDVAAARRSRRTQFRHQGSELSRAGACANDHELAQIASGAQQRAAAAARVGQEIAAGFGLTALATALAVAALG